MTAILLPFTPTYLKDSAARRASEMDPEAEKLTGFQRSFTCLKGLKTALLGKTEQGILGEPCAAYM